MKKFFILVILLPHWVFAQNTIVTATIKDASNQLYSYGTWKVDFFPTPGVPGPYTQQGTPFTQHFSGNIDATGTFTVTVASSSSISPAKSQWTFTVCPNATFPCTSTSQTVNGATLDMSANISAFLPPMVDINPAPNWNSAYSNPSIGPPDRIRDGSSYFNTTTGQPCWWYHGSFQCLATTAGGLTNVIGTGIVTANVIGNTATVNVPRQDWSASIGNSAIINKPPLTYDGTESVFSSPLSINGASGTVPALAVGGNATPFKAYSPDGSRSFILGIGNTTDPLLYSSTGVLGVAGSDNFQVSSLGGGGTRCIQVDNNGTLTPATGACGTATSGGGIVSLNGDTNAAQSLTTTGALSINNAGGGSHILSISGYTRADNIYNQTTGLTGRMAVWNTGSTCTTASAGGSTCTGNFTIPTLPGQNFTGTYYVSCSGGPATGFPFLLYAYAGGSNNVNYAISNGSASEAVASSYTFLTCFAFGV